MRAIRKWSGLFVSLFMLLWGPRPDAQSGIQYFYDELGRLVAVVDPSGDTATYTYDAVGNILSIGRHASSQVSIITFSPGSGPIGTTVLISGTGFSSTPSQNTVTFNGTGASVSAATTTQLTATVPSGATTGTIGVTSPGGSAASAASFTVAASQAPTISSFSPTIGAPGTSVSIAGTNFSTTAANNRVEFNGISSAVSAATSTSITTSVPTTATSGHVSVGTAFGKATSTADFFVPTGSYTASDVQVTGRIAVGGSTSVSLTTANKIGLIVFDGTAGRLVNVQLSSNTMGSVAVTLFRPNGPSLTSTTSSSASFSLPQQWLPVSGTYTILIDPASTNTGSISVAVSLVATSIDPPTRSSQAVLTPSSSLASNLAGLFLMNEGTGTTDLNLVDRQTASLSGSNAPVWITAEPSLFFYGGGSLNSYVNAGTGLTFDQLTPGKITIVAKVYVSALGAAGICEKNDGNTINSGFVFGWDANGALKLTVEKGTQNMRVATAAGVVGPGAWVQLAFTWDGSVGTASAAHLYMYGVEQTKASSADGSGALGYSNATNQPFRIGNASFDVTGSLSGKIAYLAVYKGRILTTTEMNQLDAALPTNTADLTQSITPNASPVTVTTTSTGQNVQLRFSANAGQDEVVQLTSNTMGSTTVSVMNPNTTTAGSATSSASSFSIGRLANASGVHTIYIQPASAGSISVAVTVTDLPPRPTSSTLDSGNSLATSLVGLFVMNEGTGTTDLNLSDSQTASFSGTSTPTWNTSDPSVVFGGGGSLNSYLNAGTDSAFDQMPTSRITVVSKVYVSTLAAAGVAEKNDGNTINSGFVFGWDANGALKLTVEKGTSNMRVATANSAIATGHWVQVAFTWDGTVGTGAVAHLFINGIEQAKASSADGSGTLGYSNATNKPFRIGTAGFDFAGSLNGKMAYLAVYKGRILTTAELATLDAQLPIH